MKEALIRKKAIKILEEEGYVVWYPPKVKWRKEVDVFGIFDLIAAHRHIVRFIQLTTLPNLSARRKKIKRWLEKNKIKWCWEPEVWAYDKKKKRFKIEKVSL